MSATNKTANYELSQYIGSDEPKYLTDYNGDMSKIDTAIKGVDTKAETANSGVATNAAAIGALDTAVGSLQTQVATVASVTNGNTGSINTINSLIGNGEPTTQDKTIIGAINEIAAGATTPEASSVTFNKTGTDLSSTNVQQAIVEVNAKIPQGGTVEADDVAYSNTSSGLTATNVQDAIDEVVTLIPTATVYDFDLTAFNGKFTVTLETGWSVTDGDGGINYALNADKSIGKIYGGGWFSGTEGTGYTWTKIATFGAGILPTISEAYNIYLGCFASSVGSSMTSRNARLHFNTDGTCELQIYSLSGQALGLNVNLPACIYFLKNFGD